MGLSFSGTLIIKLIFCGFVWGFLKGLSKWHIIYFNRTYISILKQSINMEVKCGIQYKINSHLVIAFRNKFSLKFCHNCGLISLIMQTTSFSTIELSTMDQRHTQFLSRYPKHLWNLKIALTIEPLLFYCVLRNDA